MNTKLWLKPIICIFVIGFTTPGNAASYLYTGTVVESTGAYATLIPLGTPMTGFMIFADTAVQSGFVGEEDLLGLQFELGKFCFYILVFDCTGFTAPLDHIDNVEIFFDTDGNVIGGEIDAAWFLPSDPYFPFLFDFDANTLSSASLGFGMLTVDTTIVPQLPIPGAIWLFGSVVLILTAWRRKTG